MRQIARLKLRSCFRIAFAVLTQNTCRFVDPTSCVLCIERLIAPVQLTLLAEKRTQTLSCSRCSQITCSHGRKTTVAWHTRQKRPAINSGMNSRINHEINQTAALISGIN